ncbi:MAG: hypothetical protein ACXWHF_09505, partial [Chthoniobacterales bacterium]
IFSCIPGGQARDRSAAFVLPNFASDALRVGPRERYRLRRKNESRERQAKDPRESNTARAS